MTSKIIFFLFLAAILANAAGPAGAQTPTPGPYQVPLPSGNTGQVEMTITAGDLLILLALAGVGAILLFGEVRGLAWIISKRKH